MKCSRCAVGNRVYDLEESFTSYFGKLLNGKYVIIENVPCMVCPNCGEEYFNISVAEKIDAILAAKEEGTDKVVIQDYASAA